MSIYQIVAKAVWRSASEMRNVHHYEFAEDPPTNAKLQEAVDELDAAYKDHLQGSFPNDLNVYAYDVRRVDLPNLPTAEFIATLGAWSGSSAVDPMPAQLAALVTFKSPQEYPRTSRAYMFPVTETQNDANGQVSDTLVTNLGIWAARIIQLTVATGTNPDKQAVQYGGTPRVITANHDIETFKVSKEWATQRRRRVGVGI